VIKKKSKHLQQIRNIGKRSAAVARHFIHRKESPECTVFLRVGCTQKIGKKGREMPKSLNQEKGEPASLCAKGKSY